MSRQRSLEQERAKAAWEAVSSFKKDHMSDKEKPKQGKYKALARSAPAGIQANGLGQTIAFWWAKKKEDHHNQLFWDVSKWVKSQLKWQGEANLLDWIIQYANTEEYRRATAEAMAFLNWVKRFAEAELEGEAPEVEI